MYYPYLVDSMKLAEREEGISGTMRCPSSLCLQT